MKLTDLPALVGTPFAENGIKTAISQNTSPGTNAASYNDGFPAITMTELTNGGLPPRGSDFNQILYELAKSVQWAGTGALYKFSAEFATKIGGYPKGSKVIGSDGDVYESLSDDNLNDPVGGAGWVSKGEDKNTRELWRRSLAEIGLTLVSGSFKDTATVTSPTDAVWDIDGAQCYTWTGDFPHDADGDPGAGWVSVSGLSVREYVDLKVNNVECLSSSFASLEEWAAYPARNKVMASGVYNISSTLNVECDILFFDEVEVISSGNFPLISVGSEERTVIGQLTSSARSNDTIIKLTSAIGISSGDVILIYDPTDGGYEPSRVYYRNGEAAIVSKVDGNDVYLSGGLYADYDSNTEGGIQIILPKMKSMKLSGNLSVEHPNYNANCVSLLALQLRDSDLGGLRVSSRNGIAAVILRRCFNVYGSGLSLLQRIDQDETTLGLDYALQLANCQGVELSGIFSSERHAATTTGTDAIGCIVNRGNNITGTFLTSGKGGMCAADWHGNTEHCKYGGRMQGLTIGGNNNGLIPGSIVEDVPIYKGRNSDVPAINFREITGFNFDLRGLRLKSKNTPSTVFKGVIDCGSTGDFMPSTMKTGGNLRLSGSEFDCADSQVALKIRNGSNTHGFSIDLSGVDIVNAGPRPIWIQERTDGSGVKCNSVNLNGINLNPSATELYLSLNSYKLNTEFAGTSSGTIAPGSLFMDVMVALPYSLTSTYTTSFSRTGNGSGAVTFQTLSQTASSFTVRISLSSGVALASSLTIPFQWSASYYRS